MARPPSRAERQSRSPEKPRPIQVAAKCGGCFGAFLGVVAQATTFVARLAFIRILPATQSAWDLFKGSFACRSRASIDRRRGARRHYAAQARGDVRSDLTQCR